MGNRELKVGDKVYISNRDGLIGFETIKKITPTMAKSKNYSFDKEIEDAGYIRIKGQDQWSICNGQIANKELNEEWENQKIKHWFNSEKDNFTIKQIKKIKDILN